MACGQLDAGPMLLAQLSSGAFMNALSCASIPRRGKGTSSSSSRRAAITVVPSRPSSGRHSLQPVHRWPPGCRGSGPPSTCRSGPPDQSPASPPRSPSPSTGVRRATALRARGGRRQPFVRLLLRTGASRRSDRGAADRRRLLPHRQFRGQGGRGAPGDSTSSGNRAASRLPVARLQRRGTRASTTSGP